MKSFKGTRQSLKHITGLGISAELSWLRIWDMALDNGTRGTKAALPYFNALSRPVFGDRFRPHSKLAIDQDHTYLEYLVQEVQLGSMENIIGISLFNYHSN